MSKAHRFVGLVLATVCGALVALGSPASSRAQDSPLGIELNKTEEVDGACHATFVIYSRLEAPLDRFSMDVYIFDKEGVISRRTLLEMAPIRPNKTNIATFPLIDQPCASIGHLVLNDTPSCRLSTGEDANCYDELRLWTKGAIDIRR